MKARFLLFGFLLIPIFSVAQVVDTARVRKEVDSLVQLNRRLVSQRNFKEALQIIEVADSLALVAFGRNHALYAQCQFFHGLTYSGMDEYDKAQPLIWESLSIREKVLGKEHPDCATSLNNLAVIYWKKGEYDKAEPLYWKALSIREKTLGKEHPLYAKILDNLGTLYYQKGVYDKAEFLFLEGKAILEKIHDKEQLNYARILNNLASLYLKKGEYNKSELLFLDVKAIYEKILGKERLEYAACLVNLAILYKIKGEYDKAEPLYLQSLEIREKLLGNEHPDYAWGIFNLASFYTDRGEYSKAVSLYLECKTIREKVLGKEHPDYAITLSHLAQAYSNQGQNDRAEPWLLEALAIQEKVQGKEHPDYATSLNYLANVYSNKEEYNKSEPLYLRSKDIREKVLGKEHPEYVESLNNLAHLYRDIGQPEKSEQYFTEASSITKLILQKSATYLPNQEIEKYIALYQDNNEAFYAFNRQTNADSFRIASYNNALFYKGFVLETATRLEQSMRNASDSIRDIYARWKGYNSQLAAELTLPSSKRKHFVYLDSMSGTLEKVLRRTPAFAKAQREIVWEDVQGVLQPGEAAIEFIQYRYSNKKGADNTVYSAMVTLHVGTAPQFVPLCEARQLDALVYKADGARTNYLINLYASPRKDKLPSLNQLLWSPIEKVLREQGIKTVYYSPTGLLHRLNLSAIVEGKSGIPLAERYHLVPMSSTRLLAEGTKEGLLAEGIMADSLAKAAKARQLVMDYSTQDSIQLSDALIYGGVQYEMDSTAINIANTKLNATAQDTTGGLFAFSNQTERQRGENWDYLPGTEEEARYLDNLLRHRGINPTLRLGYQATEESFKQIGQNRPSPGLLHIGTHGFFFPDPRDTSHGRTSLNGNEPVFKISEYSMIRSGLKLAGSRYAWENGHPLPGGHEDGILTAYEVNQMNLSNTQLVVLSACETGLGDIRGNEGVYGLQRAFRIAGAKNVLMSLWKVPADATEKLMTRFYNNWLEQKMPLRESFEEAQKWLRGQKGFENPYFWAGFVLVGEL